MITFPNAKINLGLHITEKRPDGYHNLETVFYPIPLEDALEVTELTDSTEKCVLHPSGISIAGEAEDNLVVKAYRQLDKLFDLPPVQIHLLKHIPSGAGLGGGSSDAAYMLKLLNGKFVLNLTDEQLEEQASKLGADCAFFVRNKPTYAEGIGNVFSSVTLSLKGYRIWVVKPDVFVSTRDAFAHITPRRPDHNLRETIQLPLEMWKDRLVNDFEGSVFPKFPLIGEIKEEMYRQGARYASMSGSGSSVYGIFDEGVQLPTGLFGKNAFEYKGILQ